MELNNKRVLTIVSADFDDLEFFYPLLRLQEAGAIVEIASYEAGTSIKGKYGLVTQSDLSFDSVDITQYDALLIPGGWAPDALRRDERVLDFVRYMDENNRVIGIICHAGWVLSSAHILKGRKVTSTPGIRDDLVYAGAEWVNQAAIADGNLISGRRPPDLPMYLPLLIDAIKTR